jgi:hypothetical protein
MRSRGTADAGRPAVAGWQAPDTLDGMTWARAWVGAVLLIAAAGWQSPVSAQLVFESAGERALGMAGAFVAVADDATAPHWNPAGLVAGQPAGMTIGWHHFQIGDQDAPAGGQRRGRSSLTSLGTWPLGISYGTTLRSRVSTDADGQLTGASLRVGYFGVTVLQSLLEGLVIGSTLKVVRGSAAGGAVDGPTAGEALDRIADLKGDTRTTFDLDVGLMASAPNVRIGLTVKNLRSPDFGAIAGNAITLPRQARAGVAVLPADGLTLAMDVDLNTVDLMGDLRRMLAVGGELAVGSRVQVRSGMRWNLADDRRATGAVGVSLSVRRGLWLDGHYGLGRTDESREFGVALRAGF